MPGTAPRRPGFSAADVLTASRIPLAIVFVVVPRLEVRLAALHALAQEGSSEATRALIRILTDDADTDLRKHAAYALGERGDAEAIQALLSVALSRTNGDVRKACVHALGQIESDDAQEALFQVIESFAPVTEARR